MVEFCTTTSEPDASSRAKALETLRAERPEVDDTPVKLEFFEGAKA